MSTEAPIEEQYPPKKWAVVVAYKNPRSIHDFSVIVDDRARAEEAVALLEALVPDPNRLAKVLPAYDKADAGNILRGA